MEIEFTDEYVEGVTEFNAVCLNYMMVYITKQLVYCNGHYTVH